MINPAAALDHAARQQALDHTAGKQALDHTAGGKRWTPWFPNVRCRLGPALTSAELQMVVPPMLLQIHDDDCRLYLRWTAIANAADPLRRAKPCLSRPIGARRAALN